MEIDANQIQAELKELAGEEKVKVKAVKRGMDTACSIRQTDKGFDIR